MQISKLSLKLYSGHTDPLFTVHKAQEDIYTTYILKMHVYITPYFFSFSSWLAHWPGSTHKPLQTEQHPVLGINLRKKASHMLR